MNCVWGLVSGGAGWENRPNLFFFGDLGDDTAACADACAAESECIVSKH